MHLMTLSKSSPQFMSYLLGTFSVTERAIPTASLNVSTDQETVTFQIVPVGEITAPPFLKKWAQIFRLHQLVSVLFPIFLILVKVLLDDDDWDPLLATLSCLGALCLAIGAFLRNDFVDHISGIDRIHPKGGTQAIQRGWVTARQTRNWSWMYFALGGALGAPAVWVFPDLLFLIALISVGAAALWMAKRRGGKYLQLAEVVSFLLFGPLLTVGFQISIGAGFDFEALWMGILTGAYFTFGVHLKNFEALLFHSQVGFENTMSLLGFEFGKRFIEIWWGLTIVMMAAYQWLYHAPEWFLAYAVVLSVASLPFLLRLRKLHSPVGSDVVSVMRAGRQLVQLVFLIWTLQTFWYLMVIEVGSAA